MRVLDSVIPIQSVVDFPDRIRRIMEVLPFASMQRLKKSFQLYMHYVSMNVRGMMQYKTSFLFTTIGQFLVSFNVFLGIFFMFQRFNKVQEFTYNEVILCYSIILLELSIAKMYDRGFDTFSDMVRNRNFDRVLVRPQNEVLQVIGSKFELTRIGHVFQAIVMFLYGIANSNVSWSFTKILTILFMIVGGTAILTGLFLIYASLCFFTLEGLEFINIFTDSILAWTAYKLTICFSSSRSNAFFDSMLHTMEIWG